MTRKHLLAICAAHPQLEVEEVEILTSPLRTWLDGIRMVPALKIGEAILSGLFINEKAITNFLTQVDSKKLLP
jgi:hypothetical protein